MPKHRSSGLAMRITLVLSLFAGAVGAALGGPLLAANQASDVRFEVASIKRHNSSTPGQMIGPQGDRFIARNVTVRDLISTAYDVPLAQISGGPVWIDSEQYEIEAKPASATTWPDQLRMLRSLLADRFNLRLQRESRDIATYDLIVSASGMKMKPAPTCRDDEKQCGGFRTAPGTAIGRHVTVAQVARLIAGRAGRRVTDATGLQGYFDIELRWNPGPAQLAPAKSGPDDAPPIDPSGPSLSVAIEEQLGLRLRSSKGTTDYFTIVAAERPREN
jgi:uncharacterized protein (TIGR03435 family)